MKPAIVVCGPTATGKSELAFWLACHFGGEVVGADSMQVYSGLTVGTAATTPQQAGGVPQHLVGFLPPQQPFSVADWLSAAQAVINDVQARGALPIVCGGTGLYIQSLVEGVRYTPQKPDAQRRTALEEEWDSLGGQALWKRLHGQDPSYAETLHPNDKKRVLRALELWEDTHQTNAERKHTSRAQPPLYSTLCIGLTYASRAALYARINARVDAMLQNGLLPEAETVWQHRHSYQTAAQAIGYKEFFPYFEGTAPLEDCVESLKQASRRYAKRQLTWFGHMPQIQWLQADDEALCEKAQQLVQRHLQAGAAAAE